LKKGPGVRKVVVSKAFRRGIMEKLGDDTMGHVHTTVVTGLKIIE